MSKAHTAVQNRYLATGRTNGMLLGVGPSASGICHVLYRI